MIYQIENDALVMQVESHGAELRTLTDKVTKREYMWCADKAYWGRTSPVLFPVVGAYRNKQCRYQGKTYELPQHGFARDMEFTLIEQTKDTLWFTLSDNEKTLENYPFAFCLEIGYRLLERAVKVMWRVKNPANTPLYFSIGGHPAFCAEKRSEEKITCYLQLEGVEVLKARKLADGLASHVVEEIPLSEGGILPVTEEVFADDALVIENNQTGKVSLLDENKKPYLSVKFDAPLFGLWTPPGKNAPFVCIEPWYGRCDAVDFAGTIEEREWGNTLAAGEEFETSYTLEV